MCGRYLISTEEDSLEMREILKEINKRYLDTPMQASIKTGEIFPTDFAPVLIHGKEDPEAVLMRWGFPRWKGSGVIINARSETAGERKMFGIPLSRSRCVVPATGFFEWRREGGKAKEKYLFNLPGPGMLYLAGLFDRHATPGRTPCTGYVVLTTAANPSVSGYHDRMPLILQKDQLGAWLFDASFALDFVHAPCAARLRAARV